MKIDPPPHVAEKIRSLPGKPGIYFWKDGQGAVIYVGKAKVLPNRVRSYFQDFAGKDVKTRLLVASIRDLDWIVTDSEKEALILENTLIKKYRPRYNIRLRDDKNFVCLKLTAEDFPRLEIVRKMAKDQATYYGPFSNAKAVRTTLRFLNKNFPLRKCNNAKFKSRTRPCIMHQIGQCEAPCVGKIDQKDYGKIVRQVKMFFKGRSDLLTEEMAAEMEWLSERLEFERAGKIRDAIRAIKATIERQKTVTDDFVDRDLFGLYREGGAAVVSVLYVRNGKLFGARSFPVKGMELPEAEVLAAVVKQYYGEGGLIPTEVCLGPDLGEERALIEIWLRDLAGRAVKVIRPQRGRKFQVLSMADQNAKSQFEARRAQVEDLDAALEKVQKRLSLRNFPHRIECFDISNLQGTNQVASSVAFVEGEPDKSYYRRYKIKTVVGQDDFSSMREVLTRRLKRSQTEVPRPDLILVDGGKGQLNIALAVLEELNIHEPDVVGFAKVRNPGDNDAQDVAFLPGRKNPVRFRRGGDDLFLLQRVRDESHRFAVEYHRKLRSKSQKKSMLDTIPGVGAARKTALLKKFGSVKRIAEADPEHVATVAGISSDLANTIVDTLKERLGES
jgi:excinuclease ABC subunit C